jgi:hypothetical protein
MPKCVGFSPSVFLIYSRQFPNAISTTTKTHILNFFWYKERIIYVADIFKETAEKCLIQGGYLNSFKYPVFMHYSFK